MCTYFNFRFFNYVHIRKKRTNNNKGILVVFVVSCIWMAIEETARFPINKKLLTISKQSQSSHNKSTKSNSNVFLFYNKDADKEQILLKEKIRPCTKQIDTHVSKAVRTVTDTFLRLQQDYYHGVHDEAAGDDLHRVQHVAEGFARRHLQGQLQGAGQRR